MDIEERFWSYVDLSGPVPDHDRILGPCAVWTGGTNRGYGQFWADGHNVPAHIWIARRKIRVPNTDEFVMHRCDNPPCVAYWAHLRVGPAYDNDLDRLSRQRQARGQSHGRTSLTDDQVLAIRARSTRRFGEQTEMAREYNVTSATIHNILMRKTWSHLS